MIQFLYVTVELEKVLNLVQMYKYTYKQFNTALGRELGTFSYVNHWFTNTNTPKIKFGSTRRESLKRLPHELRKIARLYIGCRGEQNILYKGVKFIDAF